MKLAAITFAIMLSTLTDLFAFSDTLMTRIVMLEKQLMLTPSDSLKATLLLEKANSYRQLQQYKDVLFTLNRIDAELLNVKSKQAFHYEKAVSLYMIQAYPEALAEVKSLQVLEGPSDRVELLELILLLENGMWEAFKQKYLFIAAQQGRETNTFISQFEPPQLLDAHHYKKLSGVVPGLGLIKGGHVKKGITSISLQLASAGFAAFNFYHGFYFTGLFSGLMPTRKFYRGGKTLTFTTIEKVNADNLDAFKKLGYQHLQNLY